MSNEKSSWKRLNRKTLYDSRFMKMYEDTVELPSGHLMDDYSVVDLPDGVLVVATDEENNVLVIDEYKYAADDTFLTFVAGGIDGSESVLEAARRELVEETGYDTDDLELLAQLDVYPSKVIHKSSIVRARNIRKVTTTNHEASEGIGNIRLISPAELKSSLKGGKIKTTYMLAAIALAFPEILG
ncbi:MAG: hydrolase [Candidatus Saccharibacteria bacterium]|nr:hydrolase [Candidatus Saccharibacteria bacterium]